MDKLSEDRLIALPTGELAVRVLRADFPLDTLCGFAARRNPKRGFLFVSKVLGKHIPVKPLLMRAVHTRLAGKIDDDLPGPVIFIGMAETAVALGHGVYDEYIRRTQRRDTVFLHSTRYKLDKPVAMEFREEHSHAADHIVYMPDEERNRMLFEKARTIVLVDDEASTGATFVNLAKAFKGRIPSLELVVTAVITDWRGPARALSNQEHMPGPSVMVSILEGEYSFTPAANLTAVEMPKVSGNGATKDHIIARNTGRHGLSQCFDVQSWLGHHVGDFIFRARTVKATEAYDVSTSRASRSLDSILVLGTGEFAYPPFLFAEELEKQGFDVHYQSTTRSPVMVDPSGAIAAGITFVDNYEDDIPNFVYNVTPGQYGRVLIAHETPTSCIDPKLVDLLAAELLEI